jgi:hypothetical protein
MDPSALTLGNAAPSSIVPLIGPRVQLFPLPGNIYKSACFYDDSVADLTTGDFGAVIAFTVVHGHPVTVLNAATLNKFNWHILRPLAIL